MSQLPAGAIRIDHAARRYRIVDERNHTLKEAAMRRRRGRFTDFWALHDVTAHVEPGEAIGIVGRNGSGKSTLLKLIAGIETPSRGTVAAGGVIASMLELGAGFHPDFSGRENVYLNAAIFGFSERDIDRRFDDIVEFAEVADFIDSPVRTYSSGMQMRLAFAVASHVKADIMLLDEVFAVGDEAFQRKCTARMFEFKRDGGTLVFVSHDAQAIERICDRALLIEGGRLIVDGGSHTVLARYHKLLAEHDARSSAALQMEGASGSLDAGAVPEGAAAEDDAATNRWGTGEARITHVRMVDGEGRDVTRVQSGQELTFEVGFVCEHPMEFPNVGVQFNAEDGQIIYGINTTRDRFVVEGTVSSGTVRLRVPSLHLHEGVFDITVAATSHDERDVYDWLDRWLQLTVFASGAGIGIVDLAGEWVFEADRVPASGSVASPARASEAAGSA